MIPMLVTKRLIIRAITMKDADDLFEFAHGDQVGPLAGWQPHENISVTKQIIKNMLSYNKLVSLGHYVICLKETGKMIGTIELYNYRPKFKAELGYSINPLYWGNGYAAEAALKILEYAFACLELKRVEANTFVDNYQSQRVCEKIGMRFEGRANKAYLRYDGIFFDELRYGITDEEFYAYIRKVEQNEKTS